MKKKQYGIENAPFGIVGFETAFPLLYTHFVKNGKWTLKQLVDWMTKKPAEVFGFDHMAKLEVGAPADLVLIDLEKEQAIDKEAFVSKGKNTPFNGWACTGWPVITIYEWRNRMAGGASMKTRYLILEDGTVFKGNAFGSEAGINW